MEVVVRAETAEAELDVRLPAPSAPRGTDVGALVAHVTGRPAPDVVTIDGRACAATTPLAAAGLARGSVIDTRPPGPPTIPAAAGELLVVAGPDAGRRRALPPGRYRLGPGLGAGELSFGVVSGPQLEIEVPGPTARRHELADRVVLVRPLRPAPDRPEPRALAPGSDGTVSFNRPPRPGAEAEPAPITVPPAARPVAAPRALPLLAMLAPLPAAVALAVLLGHGRFLLFGLMSPLMLGAHWIEERRTRRTEQRRAAAADDAARARLAAELTARHHEDVDRARRAHPVFTEVLEWIERAAPALWARRPPHHDAFVVPVGLGPQPWAPPLAEPTDPIDGVAALVQRLGPLPTVPITADLRTGGVGLVGPGAASGPVAAAIVLSLAALHGPADLRIVVCAGAPDAPGWEWIKWLPHAGGAGPALVTDPDAVAGALASPAAAAQPAGTAAPMTLVVAVGHQWWHGHDSSLRPALGGGHFRVLALCERAALVPACCSTLVHVPPRGPGRVEDLAGRRSVTEVVLSRAAHDRVVEGARALARLHDPDRVGPDAAGVPATVDLVDLLGLPRAASTAADVIRQRWCDPARNPRTPIGTGPSGTVVVDLAAHGPHGLVAGTTGSGKSELLRTLVTGLAVALPPDEFNVVLVDFKGGAAFDACARLPHAVGLVTDLDEHLAARVLRCLRAELARRERVLRAAGVSARDDLSAATPGGRVLARLVVVVDEFALLATELPDFVPGLVDLAQRGRSLGVHLLLATQRPAGVVDAKIRANTNLRVALRVQDDADSLDVVGGRDAALIPRGRPGRAVARFGAGELVELQVALTSGTALRSSGGDSGLSVRPFVLARPLTALERRVRATAPARPAAADGPHRDAGERSDLAALVDAIRHAAAGRPPPRRPYLEPLPAYLDAGAAQARATDGDGGGPAPDEPPGIVIGLEDRPDEQRQCLRTWRPAAGESLALYGTVGSGTSSTLASLALGVAAVYRPDDAHLYAIDGDAGRLAALTALPHTGAVVRLDEPARLLRLVRLLGRELDRRRRRTTEARTAGSAAEPLLILLIDHAGSVRQALEHDHATAGAWAALERVIREGAGLGLAAAVSGPTERSLPPSLVGHLAERLVFRLPDRAAYAAFGFRPAEVPEMVPGRALCAREHTEIQVIAPPPDLAAAVAEVVQRSSGATRRPPARLDPLPPTIDVAALAHRAAPTAQGWRVPIGIDLHDGEAVDLELRPDGPVVVAGPPGSGRTNVLAAIAAAVRAADPRARIDRVGPRPDAGGGAWSGPERPADVAAWVDGLLREPVRRLLLVDDADQLGGPSFERLAAARPTGLSVVLAGPADGLRRVGHWSRPWLRSRRGVLLAPEPADGDLVGVALPRGLRRGRPGEGLLVDAGTVVPVLCARADAPAPG